MLRFEAAVNDQVIAIIDVQNDGTGTEQTGNYEVAFWQQRPDGQEDDGRLRFTGWHRDRPVLHMLREIVDQMIVEQAERDAARDA